MPARNRQSAGSRHYNWAHQQQRTRLIAAHQDGTPCRLCGQPMYLTQGLDAGHPPWAPVATGSKPDALEHRACNRRAGAQAGNRQRGLARHGGTTSLRW